MKREIIPYTTEEAWLENRKKDLTSSDIPCLFGCGYVSYDKLVEHKRNGTSPEFEETEEILWGKALQDSIAQEFARRNQWSIRKKTEYIRIPELRIGASFDFEINAVQMGDGEEVIYQQLLEVKNVNEWKYKKDWIQGFEIQATPYIEIQTQAQLLVAGLDQSYICTLVGGHKGVPLRREANKKIHDAILMKSEKFWKDVGI